jgi:hypothetical protein
MKKIFFLIFTVFSPFLVKSQDLPKYYISKGDTLGLTLPMSQVKKIRRDLELKMVLETIKSNCDSLSNKSKNQEQECLNRLSDKDKIINQLDTSRQSKIRIIQSLNGELVTTRLDRDFQKKASQTKDSLNIVVNLKLTEVKTQRNFYLGGTVLFFITTLSLLLFH